MALDISTPKGQESLTQEREVQEIISKKWNVSVVETPKESIAACDGLLIKDGIIVACFETKCRYDMTYEQLLDRGSWLITMDKVKKCKVISKLLRVPFIGFLYLLPSSDPSEKILLFWKITNNKGNFNFDFKVMKEPTQQTINGGETVRENAYLPVNQMKVV